MTSIPRPGLKPQVRAKIGERTPKLFITSQGHGNGRRIEVG